MTTVDFVKECKIGLGISPESTAFDDLLKQKVAAVLSYMKRAGVAEQVLEDELAIGVVVMGVGDLWQTESGNVKFSAAFHILLSQLTYEVPS